MSRFLALLALGLFLPAPLDARPPDEMVEIKAGDPVSIRADRAYILFRTVRPEGVPSVEPVFLRIPTSAEMERYAAAKRAAYAQAEPGLIRQREEQLRRKAEAEASGKSFKGEIPPSPSLDTFNFVYDEVANVQRVDDGGALVKGKPESVYLVEVPAGDYILYGAAYGSGTVKPALFACMCLGTVGFPAPAGVVTDLGYFMGDRVEHISKIPELKAESGFGPSSVAVFTPLGATVRPVGAATAVPDVLRGAAVRPAAYRAIGRFVEPRAITVNRLAPVPGILAYEGRRVIDVKTGKDAPRSR